MANSVFKGFTTAETTRAGVWPGSPGGLEAGDGWDGGEGRGVASTQRVEALGKLCPGGEAGLGPDDRSTVGTGGHKPRPVTLKVGLVKRQTKRTPAEIFHETTTKTSRVQGGNE